MKLWFVGKNVADTRYGVVSEIAGVFSSKEKALVACQGPRYYICSLELDEVIPDVTMPCREFAYPLAIKSSQFRLLWFRFLRNWGGRFDVGLRG